MVEVKTAFEVASQGVGALQTIKELVDIVRAPSITIKGWNETALASLSLRITSLDLSITGVCMAAAPVVTRSFPVLQLRNARHPITARRHGQH
jgi:hypothetical protein